MTMFEEVSPEEQELVEKVAEEIMAEVDADSESVPVEQVYQAASEVIKAMDDEDETNKELLGTLSEAVAELEEIHAGETGSVSSILTEIMQSAYGTEAPTPSPTVFVKEPTFISSTKDMVTGATDTVTGIASDLISNVFNP